MRGERSWPRDGGIVVCAIRSAFLGDPPGGREPSRTLRTCFDVRLLFGPTLQYSYVHTSRSHLSNLVDPEVMVAALVMLGGGQRNYRVQVPGLGRLTGERQQTSLVPGLPPQVLGVPTSPLVETKSAAPRHGAASEHRLIHQTFLKKERTGYWTGPLPWSCALL